MSAVKKGRHRKRFLRGLPAGGMTSGEVGEYFSRDLSFRLGERYEPPYPLTAREQELLELNRVNQQEKDDTITWFKTETQGVVDEERDKTIIFVRKEEG